MSMQKSIATMVDESIRNREENHRLRDRIRELEERLHERDLVVAALAQRCDELSVALSKRQQSITLRDAGDEHEGAASGSE